VEEDLVHAIETQKDEAIVAWQFICSLHLSALSSSITEKHIIKTLSSTLQP